ncbi:hypothetical protein KI387_026924, partial [Taxus chinensis]
VVVGGTTESRTTKARVARLIHHHSSEIRPTGADGYFGEPTWDHVGVAHRFKGTCYHITGPDSDTTSLGRVGIGTCASG